MVNSCILTALLAVAPTTQTQAPDATSSSDIIIIDGKKDPSQLPEWAVWEQGFTIIAGWQGRDSGFTHDLRTALSKDEFDMLEHEASTQSERLNQASLEAEPLRVLYAHRDPKDAKQLASLNDRMQDINLKYRRATLEARNRLLEALSPESQSVLASWIGDIRAGIVARVAKADLERWRAPE